MLTLLRIFVLGFMKLQTRYIHCGSAPYFNQKTRLHPVLVSFRGQCIGSLCFSYPSSGGAFERKPSQSLRSASRKSVSARGTIIGANNILVDDLAATLEAHRAENRARVIRKVGSDVDRCTVGFHRPVVPSPRPQQSDKVAADGRTNISRSEGVLSTVDASGAQSAGLSKVYSIHIKKSKKKQRLSQNISSLQPKYGPAKGITKRNQRLVLEYEGKVLEPRNQWAQSSLELPIDSTITKEQSPWLAFMSQKHNSTGVKQYV